MKKLILTAVLLIGIGSISFAQTEGGTKKAHKTPEEKAQHVTDALSKKLSLTADQKSKIYAISLEGIKNAAAHHAAGQKTDKAAIKAEMEKRDSQINAVLDGGQRKAYQEWKTKKMDSAKKHGKKKGNKETDKA